MGMKVNAAKKRVRAEFRTAVCSWERMGGFPGAKIVRGEAKNYAFVVRICNDMYYNARC